MVFWSKEGMAPGIQDKVEKAFIDFSSSLVPRTSSLNRLAPIRQLPYSFSHNKNVGEPA
ncbi:hypothetical protein EDC23_0777 [Thiohalophilus thiocyanatoxydans]|uniref:Uncharacterized protein n=1 Tax=Thiohalophilus thiocyanatoxydans TaxID=381308 RepID=A0A4R8IXA2_9GAMM|nr:hypothetical protein EDC23_0777 [Thiohalophilus thiocyanatoxydans]